MEFVGIEKKEQGRFITRYDLTYRTADQKEKVYEMISRDKNLSTFSDLHDKPADAVVLIMHNEDRSKVLLNHEYRMPMGEWIYNFPAGLIDAGETPEEAARRELHEETGLTILQILDTIPESYSAIGFSNEKNVCVVGIASGEFTPSTSTEEEIDPAWYTKEEIRALIASARFSARSQAYLYLWSKE